MRYSEHMECPACGEVALACVSEEEHDKYVLYEFECEECHHYETGTARDRSFAVRDDVPDSGADRDLPADRVERSGAGVDADCTLEVPAHPGRGLPAVGSDKERGVRGGVSRLTIEPVGLPSWHDEEVRDV